MIDFIDMSSNRNQRAVENRIREALDLTAPEFKLSHISLRATRNVETKTRPR